MVLASKDFLMGLIILIVILVNSKLWMLLIQTAVLIMINEITLGMARVCLVEIKELNLVSENTCLEGRKFIKVPVLLVFPLAFKGDKA